MKKFNNGITILCIGVLLFVLGVLFILNVKWFIIDSIISIIVIIKGICMIFTYITNKNEKSKKL